MISKEEIQARAEFIRATWELQDQPHPPFIVRPRGKWYASREALENSEVDLQAQLQMLEKDHEIDDYAIPALYPGVGIAVIGAAFGGEPVLSDTVEERDPWTPHLISDKNPEDVYKLELPNPRTSGMNPLAFERIKVFQAGSDLPLRVCNIPSPLTAASQIWDYTDFLSALYYHPKEVHHLLDLCTEAIIAFTNEQLKEIKHLFGLTAEDLYLPRDLGIRVSDDVLAEISPRHYREFAIPYNNRLSEAFGGIFVHSCGDVTHNLDAIKEIKDLRGIEINAPQNKLDLVKEKAAGQMVVSLRYWLPDWVNRDMPDLETYSKELIDFLGPKGLMLMIQSLDTAEAHRISKAIKTPLKRKNNLSKKFKQPD